MYNTANIKFTMDSPCFVPSQLFDQNFGMCFTPQDVIVPSNSILNPNYFRPWKWYMPTDSKDCGSTIENDKEKFQVTLDVQHFRPNEINVKIVNQEVVIEGKHEERLDDHGMVSRQFMRRYPLPSECEPEDVISNLSSDGVLVVIVNKKSKQRNEITVPIKLCDSYSKKIELQSYKDTMEMSKNCTSTLKKEDKCDFLEKEAEGTSSCKKSSLMLKDEHSCLLKPDFLKETSTATQKMEAKSETEEQLKVSSGKADEYLSAMSLPTGGMLKLNKDRMGKNSNTATNEALTMATDFTSQSGKMSAIEKSFMKASDVTAKSSLEATEETVKISEILGATAISTAAEKSSFSGTSMSSETVTSKETSSSFMSSIMSSSLKASSEKSSELCDTIAALKEAAENL